MDYYCHAAILFGTVCTPFWLIGGSVLKIFLIILISLLSLSCDKPSNQFNQSIVDCGPDMQPQGTYALAFDHEGTRIDGPNLRGQIIDQDRSEGKLEFTEKGCFAIPETGTVRVWTSDLRLSGQGTSIELNDVKRLYLALLPADELKAAGPLEDRRPYFGKEHYFVDPGYALNFYSIENLVDLEIEFCITSADPRDLAEGKVTCDDYRAFFLDAPPILDKGSWLVKYKTRENRVPTELLFTVEKRCLSVYYQSALVKEDGCTSVSGLNLSAGDRIEGLESLSRVEGELRLTNLHVEDYRGMPNVSRVGSMFATISSVQSSLRGMDHLRVSGNAQFNFNTSRISIDPLATYSISGDLIIDNGDMEDLSGLKETNFSGLSLSNMSRLKNLDFLKGRDEIQGNLILKGISIKNLAALSQLKKVGGSLELTTLEITSLKGLEALTTVQGKLEMSQLWLLDSVESLKSLKSVGELTLWDLPLVDNFDIFKGIEGLSGLTLSFVSMPALPVGSFGESVSTIDISNVESLEDISKLSTIRKITNRLRLQSLPALTSLKGLENISAVAGDLWLQDLPVDDEINQIFANLEQINILQLHELPKVTSLEAFRQFKRLNGLRLSGLGLQSLDDLKNLSYVGSDGLFLAYMDQITSLEGLSTLKRLDGFLSINGLFSQTSLKGLDKLTELPVGLDLLSLTSLNSVEGLQNVTKVGPEGIALNGSTTQLTDFRGLESLQSVDGNFTIFDFPEDSQLKSFSGLESLKTVNGHFEVNGHGQLTSLEGLNHLAIVGRRFSLIETPALSDISAVSKLEHVGEIIEMNSSVCQTIPAGFANTNPLVEWCSLQESEPDDSEEDPAPSEDPNPPEDLEP